MVEYKEKKLENLNLDGCEKIAEYNEIPQLYKKLENGNYFLYEVLGKADRIIGTASREIKLYDDPISGFSIVENNENLRKYYVFVRIDRCKN